ncbi:hypothetical protein HDU67_000037 [Dinochytrium kinnereticum]|nr:hypothetical protein HDU67_000037 [Dinochytrium kinnereticum]
MVILVVKRGEEHDLNAEFTLTTRISEVVEHVSNISCQKVRLKRLVQATSDILKHGTIKYGFTEKTIKELEEEDDDDDEDEGQASSSSSSTREKAEKDPRTGTLMNVAGRQFIFNPDPTGYRNGESPVPEIATTVQGTLDEANRLLDKDHAKSGKYIREDEIKEAMRLIGGALTIAYPMGLPGGEPAKVILEDKEDPEDVKEMIRPFEATLWWAGRELIPTKTLGEFVGKNEKTKIVVKLQRKSQGAPVREPPLDEMSQRNLMAYYYKKQEQQKRLEENQDDDYLQSAWANPKSLKQSFQGLSNVSWGPR